MTSFSFPLISGTHQFDERPLQKRTNTSAFAVISPFIINYAPSERLITFDTTLSVDLLTFSSKYGSYASIGGFLVI
jgi:hypothetical protein